MTYPAAAWGRAMTVQDVMLKALGGELHWFRAADILGWSHAGLAHGRMSQLRGADFLGGTTRL